LLLQHALNLARLDNLSMPIKLDSCRSTAAPRQGPTYDSGSSDQCQLLGSGTRLVGLQASKLLACLRDHAEQLGPGWGSAQLDAAFAEREPGFGVYSYHKADTGRELISTVKHGKPGGRQNFYVQVSFSAAPGSDDSDGGDSHSSQPGEAWVGEIQHLLLLHHPSATTVVDAADTEAVQHSPDDDLRVAVLKLFAKPDAAQAEQLLGTSWEADDRQLLCITHELQKALQSAKS
jgi:hypothetical protein